MKKSPSSNTTMPIGIIVVILTIYMYYTSNKIVNKITNAYDIDYISRSKKVDEETVDIVQLPPLNKVPYKDRAILYFHVGKTGGTSLDRVFLSNCYFYAAEDPRGEECFNYHKAKNITLSKVTKKTFHMWKTEKRDIHRNIRNHNITSILFSIRNPVSRVVSAFNMEHLNNTDIELLRQTRWGFDLGIKLKTIFYKQCFPTVEDLTLTLARKRNATYVDDQHENLDCYELGLKAIKGIGSEMQGGHHLRCNYGFYFDQIKDFYANMEIFVLRMENLWRDTDVLNRALGGNLSEITDEMKSHRFSYNSENQSVTSGLSNIGKQYLCCHLCTENEIFEKLVQDAVNLAELEKLQYVEDLYNDCGISVPNTEAIDFFTPFNWSEWQKEKCQVGS